MSFQVPDTCSLAACLAAVASGAQIGLSLSFINYYYLIIIILPLEVQITGLKTKFKTDKKSWKRSEVRLAVG